MSRKTALAAIAAVIAAACILYSLSMNCVAVGELNDDAMYVTAARAFTAGQGMRETFDPEAPKMSFPPGFPMLLAIPVLIVWPDFWLLRIFALIFSLASIYMLYRYFTRCSDSLQGLAVAALFALSPVTVLYSCTVMADFPYLLCSFAALYLAERLKSRTDKGEWQSVALLACLALVSFWLRMIGVSLIAAIVIAMLLKRRFLPALACLTASALAYAGIGFFSDTTRYGVMKQSMGVMKSVEIVLQNLQYYLSENFFIVPRISEPYNTVILIVLVTLLALGLVIRWKKGAMGMLDLYLLGYSCLLLTYPYFSNRLVMPILPVLLHLIVISIREIAGQRREKAAIVLLCVLMTAAYAFHDVSIVKASLSRGFRETIYDRPYRWMKEHLPAGAVIMSDHPPGLYLCTGFKGVVFSGERASYNRLRHIYFGNVSYIFFNPDLVGASRVSAVESLSRAHLITVAENPRDFEKVYEDAGSGVVIYRVTGDRDSYLEAYRHLMSAYRLSQAGDRQQALEELSKCLGRRPLFPEALNLKGSLMLEGGDRDGAIETFRELLAYSSGFAKGHYNLGRAYRESSRLEEARREFEAAFECAKAEEDIALMEGALKQLRELGPGK